MYIMYMCGYVRACMQCLLLTVRSGNTSAAEIAAF
jgi:hypothetical protein